MNTQTDKDAGYVATTMWDPTGVTSYHGNGSIDINGPSADINLANNATPLGAEYNGNDDASLESSDYSCTKACHQGAGNDNHNMGDSAWPLKYADYGAGNCNGCHGYPPLNAADFAARGGELHRRPGRHDVRRLRGRRRRPQRRRSRRPDGAGDGRVDALPPVSPLGDATRRTRWRSSARTSRSRSPRSTTTRRRRRPPGRPAPGRRPPTARTSAATAA